MKLLSTIKTCIYALNLIHQGPHPLHDFHERNLPWETNKYSDLQDHILLP